MTWPSLRLCGGSLAGQLGICLWLGGDLPGVRVPWGQRLVPRELPSPCRERGPEGRDGGGAVPRAVPPHQEAEDQPLQRRQGAASGGGPDPRYPAAGAGGGHGLAWASRKALGNLWERARLFPGTTSSVSKGKSFCGLPLLTWCCTRLQQTERGAAGWAAPGAQPGTGVCAAAASASSSVASSQRSWGLLPGS